MTLKEAFIKGCKIAAFVIPTIIVFIAGIIAKEGVEASGFDKFIGWAAMVVAVGSLVCFFLRYRKQNKTAVTKPSATTTVKEKTQKANTKNAKKTKK